MNSKIDSRTALDFLREAEASFRHLVMNILTALCCVIHLEIGAQTLTVDSSSWPFARTNTPNVFYQNQNWRGDYNQIYGQSLNFHRPNINSPSWIRWFRDDDTNSSTAFGGNYFAAGMDFAVGGYYWSLYCNLIGQDVFLVGVDPPYVGRFKIGIDGLKPGVQLGIHDVDSAISNSVEILSWNDGIRINTRNAFSDMLTLQRDNYYLGHYINWHQGNGRYDWRVGMNPTHLESPYDLVFFNGLGTNSSPDAPGAEVLRLGTFPAKVVINAPVYADGSGISNTIPPAWLMDELSNLTVRVHKIEQAIK